MSVNISQRDNKGDIKIENSNIPEKTLDYLNIEIKRVQRLLEDRVDDKGFAIYKAGFMAAVEHTVPSPITKFSLWIIGGIAGLSLAISIVLCFFVFQIWYR